mgnify:CR=1 FL=1
MLLYKGSGGNTLCGDIQSIPRYFPSQFKQKPRTAMRLLFCLNNSELNRLYTEQ